MTTLPPTPHPCATDEDRARPTARAALPHLLHRTGAGSVLQLGCGTGTWLAAALEAGAREIAGVDSALPPPEALRIPRAALHSHAAGTRLELGRRFDLVLAPDLGALPPEHAEALVDDLARHGDILLVGSAGPGTPPLAPVAQRLRALGLRATEGLLPAGFATDARVAPWYRRGLRAWTNEAARARLGLAPTTDELPIPTADDEELWQPEPIPLAALGDTPRVAVVIPCHDYARFLPDAIASVAAQTWPRVDCIVVDDGSTDDTADVVRELIARHPGLDLRLVQQPNLGVAQARNRGVRSADADLVMQLDADDRLEPDAVARLVTALQADRRAAVAHCDAREFGEGDALLAAAPAVTLGRLRRANCLNYCALMRRETFLALGGYRDIRGGYDDWDLWLSAAEAGLGFVHVPAPLLRYRRHGRSLMDRERARATALRAQVVLNHPQAFSRRELTLAADVLARDGAAHEPDLALRLRLALDALLAGRVRRAVRHLTPA